MLTYIQTCSLFNDNISAKFWSDRKRLIYLTFVSEVIVGLYGDLDLELKFEDIQEEFDLDVSELR